MSWLHERACGRRANTVCHARPPGALRVGHGQRHPTGGHSPSRQVRSRRVIRWRPRRPLKCGFNHRDGVIDASDPESLEPCACGRRFQGLRCGLATALWRQGPRYQRYRIRTGSRARGEVRPCEPSGLCLVKPQDGLIHGLSGRASARKGPQAWWRRVTACGFQAPIRRGFSRRLSRSAGTRSSVGSPGEAPSWSRPCT